MRNSRENGIALITSLLVLLLLSTMIVGIAWLVLGDQKLGGNNSDRQLAFYGAEAGMESLTASLENLFDANYAPDATQINNLLTNPGPPSNIPNVQYIAPGQTTAGSGYQISFVPSTTNASIPASAYGTIPTGTYAGLVGMMTPYTLTVTARTAAGSEVRLQREVQTVGIPVFQFGFFSQTDLDFFAGPNFNFGGRVHTNGNLWLAEGSGDALTLNQKVTTAGEIISSNLENGHPTVTDYPGAIDITNGSGGTPNLLSHTPDAGVTQSVTGTSNNFTSISPFQTAFSGMASSVYNNYIAVGQPNGPVTPLNLAIATPAIGGQPIDLIRRPQPGENTSNSAKFQERYYGNVDLSMRILLSDYGPSGNCASSDISSTGTNALPNLSPGNPIDLATLAWDTSATAGGGGVPPYNAAPSWMPAASVGKTVFPLPVSGAKTGSAYITSSGAGYSGYWIKQYYPIITGCLKIEYQSLATPGTWVDVTQEILELGYTGRNINPQVGVVNASENENVPSFSSYTLPTNAGVPVQTLTSPTVLAQVNASGPTVNPSAVTVGCQDPSPNAVIRLARLRDNPSTAVGGNGSTNGNDYCGNNNSTNGSTLGTWSGLPTKTSTCTSGWPTDVINCPSLHGTDYWPNVLYDTREALPRDFPLLDASNNPQYTLAGGMYYVELDVKNLAKWFTGAIGVSGTNAFNTTGYAVYFSDRRAERQDNQSPPPSVGPSPILTGGYGYEDFVNSATDAKGCPNGSLDQGEDDEGDYNSSGVDTTPVLKTYGGTPQFDNSAVATIVSPIATLGGTSNILQSNHNCAGTITTPFAVVASSATAEDPQELRENPPLLFRRALKIIDGDTISLGTCSAVACGFTVASENPVYIQGCFNNPGQCTMTSVTSWSASSVGSAVVADAVTLLSDNWNDVNSFIWPYGTYNSSNSPVYMVSNSSTNGRGAVSTTYRVAVAAGKGIPFVEPTFTGVYQDFGTDGGAHNFLRYLENWGGNTLYYEGSIVSMFYNHQAEGIYKCCQEVYSPPTRGYQFDTNFLTPNLLPPLTPMLRLVNTIGFTQMLLPTQ